MSLVRLSKFSEKSLLLEVIMFVNIIRKMQLNKYEYSIEQDDSVSAEALFDYGILSRRITSKGNNIKYTMKQNNWLLKILMVIPKIFIPIDLFPKYNIFLNENIIGKTKVAFCTPKREIMIDNSLYEIYLHSNNYISIMKDDVQIALIKKSVLTVGEKNRYDVDFDYVTEKDKVFVLLMVSFIDIVFFPNRLRFDAVKCEKTIGKDKMAHRTLWQSKK